MSHKFRFIATAPVIVGAVVTLIDEKNQSHRATVVQANPKDLIAELADTRETPAPRVWADIVTEAPPPPPPSPEVFALQTANAELRAKLAAAETEAKKWQDSCAVATAKLVESERDAKAKADAQARTIAAQAAELATLKVPVDAGMPAEPAPAPTAPGVAGKPAPAKNA